jgi:putative redox protein
MTDHGKGVIAGVTVDIAAARYATTIRTRHHDLVADEPVAVGGGEAGPSPFELVLSGLGACTAITLRMYADRKQWPLAAVHVALAFHRGDAETWITRELRLDGALDEAQRARLADIAERTPVTLLVKNGTDVRTILK